VDGHDLHAALTAVDHRLNKLYPGRLGEKALMGYSMGAFDSLYVAAGEATNQLPLLKFDRYVAINTPVQLLHGVSKLDEFYQAPLVWPEAERTSNIENTFLKVAALSKNKLTPQTSLPFGAIESKFLIGLNFRFTLRDMIYSSQRRHNQGLLRHPVWNFRREPVYQEILQYSYQDYFEKFAAPYYQTQGMTAPAETLKKAGDLRTYAAGLRANPAIRVIVNQNDFLLADEDLSWLRATFAPKQLTVFEQGGHLGNLHNPAVQKTIVEALSGLK
jgi:pimeloyl-ACP methyl ester carboxylesterase